MAMRQVGLTHEIGGFAEYSTLDHFRTRAELRQGIDGHEVSWRLWAPIFTTKPALLPCRLVRA